ncbi:MAG TPA: serine/threonine-protein kinase, partial [Arachnia sp.]|nr:serine/threonine-protein kinase [Arachnia sp.]
MAQRTTPPDLPGFVYLDWLGGGGFADVFRYQDALGRKVAVKVLHGGGASAFDAEANLMAKLSSHPNIVSVLQAGVAADGRPFLVMEECGTAHLGARIAKRLLTASKAMEIAIQVAGAVETAHRMGILHRDIKPANILFTEFGRPALTDFGISEGADVRAANNALSRLWAPQEQYPDSGLAMGPWSDVFSLAATAWAMLVGRSPLEEPGGANDRLSLRHRARTFTPRPTGRQDVPDLLERVLATGLARDPQQRYPSALDFARALQGVQGQMNESVTPIDVLSDRVDDDLDDATELHDSGTRISGFMLIDPDQGVDSTATSTGPSSGVTSPFEHSDPQAPAPPAPQVSQVVLHGRGSAAPGVRDFTGPAVPDLDTVLDAPEVPSSSAPTLEPEAKKRRGPLIGA